MLDGDDTEYAIDIAKEITIGVMESSKHSYIKNIALLANSAIVLLKIKNFSNQFCTKLNSKLSSDSKEKNDVNKVIEDLADQVTEKIFSFIIDLGLKFTNRIKNPMIDKLFDGKNPNKGLEPGLDPELNGDNKLKIENALKTLGLSGEPSEADINKAYRFLALKHHPDKGGDAEQFRKITEAKDHLLEKARNKTSISTKFETEYKKPAIKLIMEGNSDINDCAQNVMAKIFGVDKHDLSMKTGVLNTRDGSHVSDHEIQFKRLGLEPSKTEFNGNKNEISNFLHDNQASKSMLFLNNPHGIGHVFTVEKINGDLIVHDNGKIVPLDLLTEYTGTLLTGKNLDHNIESIRDDILSNERRPLVSDIHRTGQNTDQDLFGAKIFGKYFTQESFSSIENVNIRFEIGDREAIREANRTKMVKFVFDNDVVRFVGNDNRTGFLSNCYQAHFCPFILNTIDWNGLKQTEVVLTHNNPKPDVMFSGCNFDFFFSTRSLIIAVGEHDIKVYSDTNPIENAVDKIRHIAEDQRMIYRIDHIRNQEFQLPGHNIQFYGNSETEANSVSTANFILFHNGQNWNYVTHSFSFDLTKRNPDLELNKNHMPIILSYSRNHSLDTISNMNFSSTKLLKFHKSPREFFLNKNIDQKLTEKSYEVIAREEKLIDFDLNPSNYVNNKEIFLINPHPNGQFRAHYAPYIAGTPNWNTLRKTECTVSIKNPIYKFVLTGLFSGCCFIIAVGKDDMKIYHDDKTEKNVAEKYNGLISDENRQIIRVDSDRNLNDENIISQMPCVQLTYGDKDNTTLPFNVEGQVMMFYDSNEWYLSINSYISIGYPDRGKFTSKSYQYKLSEIMEKFN